MRQRENGPQTAEVGFWKPSWWNWVFGFWTAETEFSVLNIEVSSVRFLENCYPTFSSGFAHR